MALRSAVSATTNNRLFLLPERERSLSGFEQVGDWYVRNQQKSS